MQELSKEICKEYQQKVQRQKNTDYFGNWKIQRELGHELQSKCNIPQIWALNIVNGYYIQDYLAIQKGDTVKFTCIDSHGLKLNHQINDKVYEITYVLNGWGIKNGFVVFGIKECELE